MKKELSFFTKDFKETMGLGKKIAKIICPGDLIFLQGDLGSGKTTFMRGLLTGLDFSGKVKSPSYNLLEQYDLNFTINHFDLYRFKTQNEWDDAGFNEFINNVDINIIEWPEKAIDSIPQADLAFLFKYQETNSRHITVHSNTSRGEQCIDFLS